MSLNGLDSHKCVKREVGLCASFTIILLVNREISLQNGKTRVYSRLSSVLFQTLPETQITIFNIDLVIMTFVEKKLRSLKTTLDVHGQTGNEA